MQEKDLKEREDIGDKFLIPSGYVCGNAPTLMRHRANGRRYLAKDVALYEEIFYALAGDDVLETRPIPSRSEDAPGVGHHGV